MADVTRIQQLQAAKSLVAQAGAIITEKQSTEAPEIVALAAALTLLLDPVEMGENGA